MLAYLSSAQQDLSNEPQENIRKPIIKIVTLDSDSQNTGVSRRNSGELTSMQHSNNQTGIFLARKVHENFQKSYTLLT